MPDTVYEKIRNPYTGKVERVPLPKGWVDSDVDEVMEFWRSEHEAGSPAPQSSKTATGYGQQNERGYVDRSTTKPAGSRFYGQQNETQPHRGTGDLRASADKPESVKRIDAQIKATVAPGGGIAGVKKVLGIAPLAPPKPKATDIMGIARERIAERDANEPRTPFREPERPAGRRTSAGTTVEPYRTQKQREQDLVKAGTGKPSWRSGAFNAAKFSHDYLPEAELERALTHIERRSGYDTGLRQGESADDHERRLRGFTEELAETIGFLRNQKERLSSMRSIAKDKGVASVIDARIRRIDKLFGIAEKKSSIVDTGLKGYADKGVGPDSWRARSDRNWEKFQASEWARMNPLERTLRNVGKGVQQSAEGLAGAGDWMGIPGAAGVRDWLHKDMESQRNPNEGFLDKVAQAFGSNVLFAGTGLGVRGIAMLGGRFSPAVGRMIASGGAAAAEAMVEAGDTFSELLRQGVPRGEAQKRAAAHFVATAVLTTLTNKYEFADMAPGKMARIKRTLAAMPAEAIEEGHQTIASNVAAGRAWNEGLLESSLIGAVVGGAMRGAAELGARAFERGVPGAPQRPDFLDIHGDPVDAPPKMDEERPVEAQEAPEPQVPKPQYAGPSFEGTSYGRPPVGPVRHPFLDERGDPVGDAGATDVDDDIRNVYRNAGVGTPESESAARAASQRFDEWGLIPGDAFEYGGQVRTIKSIKGDTVTLTDEGGLLIGVDKAAAFVFGKPGEPVVEEAGPSIAESVIGKTFVSPSSGRTFIPVRIVGDEAIDADGNKVKARGLLDGPMWEQSEPTKAPVIEDEYDPHADTEDVYNPYLDGEPQEVWQSLAAIRPDDPRLEQDEHLVDAILRTFGTGEYDTTPISELLERGRASADFDLQHELKSVDPGDPRLDPAHPKFDQQLDRAVKRLFTGDPDSQEDSREVLAKWHEDRMLRDIDRDNDTSGGIDHLYDMIRAAKGAPAEKGRSGGVVLMKRNKWGEWVPQDKSPKGIGLEDFDPGFAAMILEELSGMTSDFKVADYDEVKHLIGQKGGRGMSKPKSLRDLNEHALKEFGGSATFADAAREGLADFYVPLDAAEQIWGRFTGNDGTKISPKRDDSEASKERGKQRADINKQLKGQKLAQMKAELDAKIAAGEREDSPEMVALASRIIRMEAKGGKKAEKGSKPPSGIVPLDEWDLDEWGNPYDEGTHILKHENGEWVLAPVAKPKKPRAKKPAETSAVEEFEKDGLKEAEAAIEEFLAGIESGTVKESRAGYGTDTEAFRKWFGESKVVDADGKPLRVYHGTRTGGFDAFENRGGTISTFLGSEKVERHGFFFTDNPAEASEFAGKEGSVIPAFLSIQNPIDITDGFTDDALDRLEEHGIDKWGLARTRVEDFWEVFDGEPGGRLVAALKKIGHDGAIILEFNPDTKDEFKSYIAFEPTQIKSATANKGTFDPNDPSILKEARADYGSFAAPFFSKLERVAQEKLPNKASADQIRKTLLAAGVKPDEMHWTGMDALLEGGGTITKQDLLDHLTANQVKVEEVEKRSKVPAKEGRIEKLQNGKWLVSYPGLQVRTYDSEEEALTELLYTRERLGKDTTKHAQWSLPGGEDYRELLLTLPNPSLAKAQGEFDDARARGESPHNDPALLDRLRKANSEQFTSHAFDEPNILAWIRFDTRDGGKTLHIAEIQSDWHQKGRKQGYDAPVDREKLRAELEKAIYDDVIASGGTETFAAKFAKKDADRAASGHWGPTELGLPEALHDLGLRVHYAAINAKSAVPDAPFKKTWHELAMKRMIRYAAENGYERLTWDTGDTSAERYENALQEQVDEVQWQPETSELWVIDKEGSNKKVADNVTETNLEDHVGKEVAAKLIDPASTAEDNDTWRVVAGDDLKVGGAGMRGFYDKILVAFVNKYAKQWGGKVEDAVIDAGTDRDAVQAASRAQQEANSFTSIDESDHRKRVSVHSLTITPEMRSAVLQGQALFESRQGYGGTFIVRQAKPDANLSDEGREQRDRHWREQYAKQLGAKEMSPGVWEVPDDPGMRQLADQAEAAGYITRDREVKGGLFGGDEDAQGALFEQRKALEGRIEKLEYETRPGTTTEQTDGGRSALHALARIGTIRSFAITKELVDTSSVSLVGQVVEDHKDLALLSQALRDPRLETLRYFFTKDGYVLAHTGFSNRLPGVTVGFSGTIDERDAWLKESMDGLGADGYWVLHNHPSGNSVPSYEDQAFSIAVADRVPGYKGHVVIDSGEYTVIDKNGGSKKFVRDFGEDRLLKAAIKNPINERYVHGPAHLADIGKQLELEPNMSVLVATDSQNKIRAMMEVPSALLTDKSKRTKAIATMRHFGKRSGAGGGVSLVMDEAAYDSLDRDDMRKAIETDLLIDIVTTTKYGETRSIRAALDVDSDNNFRLGERVPSYAPQAWESKAPRLTPKAETAMVELALYHMAKGTTELDALTKVFEDRFSRAIVPYMEGIFNAARRAREQSDLDSIGIRKAASKAEKIADDPVGQTNDPGEVLGDETDGDVWKPRIIVSRPTDTPAFDESVIPERLIPHLSPEQRQGAAASIAGLNDPEGPGGFLLGDGTGVGKTRQILAVGDYFADAETKVLIVAPASVLKYDPKANSVTGSYADDGRAMGIEHSHITDKMAKLEPGEIKTISYHLLMDAYKAGNPLVDANTVLIFDETHELRGTERWFKTADTAIGAAKKVLYATATPADKPIHLPYLSRMGILEGQSLYDAMVGLGMRQDIRTIKTKTGARIQKEVWVTDNPHNTLSQMDELFTRLTKDGRMIKREISMDGVEVAIDEIPRTQEMNDRAHAIANLAVHGMSDRTIAIHQRLQLEQDKVPATVEWIKKELDAGRRPIVFVALANPSEAGQNIYNDNGDVIDRVVASIAEGTPSLLRAALAKEGITDVAEIHGGQSDDGKVTRKKQIGSMSDFQAGNARVVIATVEAGGTGINLDDRVGNAPRSTLFMSAPYSGIAAAQAFGRAHRMTTRSLSKITFLSTGLASDLHALGVLGGKFEALGATVRSESANTDAFQAGKRFFKDTNFDGDFTEYLDSIADGLPTEIADDHKASYEAAQVVFPKGAIAWALRSGRFEKDGYSWRGKLKPDFHAGMVRDAKRVADDQGLALGDETTDGDRTVSIEAEGFSLTVTRNERTRETRVLISPVGSDSGSDLPSNFRTTSGPRVDPITGTEPRSPRDIILDISKLAGRKVQHGGARRKAAGTYYHGNAQVSIRYSGDLRAAAHEIAHALDDKFGIVAEWASPGKRSPYDDELRPLWRTTAKKNASFMERRAEGVAEWFSLWLVNPTEAQAKAPTFNKFIESKLPADLLTKLRGFGDDIRVLEGASGHEQIMSNVRWEPPKAGIKERLTGKDKEKGPGFQLGWWDHLTKNWQDSLRPFHKAVEWLRDATGESELRPSRDPSVLARLTLGHLSKVDDVMGQGMVDAEGNRVTDGGLTWLYENVPGETLEEITENSKRVVSFMLAQRTIEKGSQLEKDLISGIGAGFRTDMETAEKRLKEIRANPTELVWVAEAASRYREWADSLLRYMVDKGRLSEEAYGAIKENNLYYVAMRRVMELAPGEEVVSYRPPSGSGKALGSRARLIFTFHGSTRLIENPYVSLIEATYRTIKETDKNEALSAFFDLVRSERRMYEGDPVETASVARKATDQDSHNVVGVYKDGKLEKWVVPDDDLFKALKGITDDPYLLPQWATIQARLLRWGVTNFPTFAIRNKIRDVQQVGITSYSGTNPLDSAKLHDQATKSGYAQSGGGQFGHYMADPRDYYKLQTETMRELAESRDTVLVSPVRLARFVGKGYRSLLEGSELSTRLAEYQRAYRKARREHPDWSERDAMLHAAAQARDLMDFAVAGVYVRIINQVVPFTNAGVQGIARSVRAVKTDPVGTSARWAVYAMAPRIAELLLASLFGYDDEFEQLPAHQRDMFYNFKLGDDLWLSIPAPWEFGVISSGVGRAWKAIRGEDDAAFDGFVGSMRSALPLDNFIELGMGNYSPLAQARSNFDEFRHRTIVPAHEEQLLVKHRDTSKASRLGQVLQQVLGVDARKIDFVIRAQFGYAGSYATSVSNIGRDDAKGPGIETTGLFRGSPASASRDVDWAMDYARSNGLTQGREYKELSKLRDEFYDAENSADRDEAGRALREFASELRKVWESEKPVAKRFTDEKGAMSRPSKGLQMKGFKELTLR